MSKLRQRLAREPYRIALEGWRALERGDVDEADRALARSLALDASNVVTRYRYAQLLIAQGRDRDALVQLERVLAASAKPSPVVRANALFDSAQIVARLGDLGRAKALYREASHVFGADRIITERAAKLAQQ